MEYDLLKYICVALFAGILVAGIPGKSYSFVMSTDCSRAGEKGGPPICGPGGTKGATCRSGDGPRECCSKDKKKTCLQTCTKMSDGQYHWTEGNPCWNVGMSLEDGESVGEIDVDAVTP